MNYRILIHCSICGVVRRSEMERCACTLPSAPSALSVPRVPWWQWVVELASVLQPDDTVERMKRLEID